MTVIALSRGRRLYYQGVEYVVDGRMAGGDFLLMTPSRGQALSLSEEDFRRGLAVGDVRIVSPIEQTDISKAKFISVDLGALPAKTRARVDRRDSYLTALRNRGIRTFTPALGSTLEEVRRELGDKKAPSWITVYRWNRLLTLGEGDIRAIVPADAFKGSIDDKVDEEVRDICEAMIEKYGGGTARFSVLGCYRQAIDEITKANALRSKDNQLEFPSQQYVYRLFAQLDLHTQEKRRNGNKAANLKFGPVHGVPDPDWANAIVEIDHTIVNLFVVDDKTGAPLGRPWLTIALDRASRMIIGFYISFWPPSYEVVAACLRNAILPKDYVKEAYPLVEGIWIPWGKPKTILVDRGIEFTSAPLKDACKSLNIRLEWTPRRRPWHKGKVERFFRTIAEDLFHTLTGAARPLPQRRDEEKPWKGARITLSGLRLLVHLWIIDYYGQKPHSGIRKMAPARKYADLTSRHPITPFNSLDSLDVLLGRVEEHGITRAGIRIKGLRYDSDFVRELLIRPENAKKLKAKEKILVKVKLLENTDEIHVLDPREGRYRPVPVVKDFAEYTAGLTWHQHAIISYHAREETKNGAIPIWVLARTRARIQEIAHSAWVRPDKKMKAKLALFLNIDPRRLESADEFIILPEQQPRAPKPAPARRKGAPSHPNAQPEELPPPQVIEDSYANYVKTQDWR